MTTTQTSAISARKQPEFDQIAACAKAVDERLKALGIKGPARYAEAGMHYAVGFCKALELAGYDTTDVQAWIAYDLAYDAPRAIAAARAGEAS
jgi:hypothetical protein